MANRIFRDRTDAAQQLAEKMKSLELHNPVVLGIPRGGVVTGAVLARQLNAELDVVLARKLRAPGQPELAVGAISEDGQVYLDSYGEMVSREYLEEEQRQRLAELQERRRIFREARPAARLEGRSVILVDDGIATGSTMLAALKIVQNQNPRETIVAVPVAPPERLEVIREHCDRLICLEAPAYFMAIGQFYEQFEQVDDEQVCQTLRELAPAHRAGD